MPVLGRYWADAASIGPVLAQYWHIMACWDSMNYNGCLLGILILDESWTFKGNKFITALKYIKHKILNTKNWDFGTRQSYTQDTQQKAFTVKLYLRHHNYSGRHHISIRPRIILLARYKSNINTTTFLPTLVIGKCEYS